MKTCPENLGDEITGAILDAARMWINSEHRPKILPEVSDGWTALLQNWLRDDSLPILVRSSKGAPGSVIIHPAGAQIVPTDNSPASWAFTLAEKAKVPTLDEIKYWFNADQIPVAMAIKRKDKPVTKYFCNLATVRDNPNNRGWKVAHIEPVGLRQRGELEAMRLEDLKAQFLRFLSPINMFVVPKKWAGFSEIDEVTEAFKTSLGR